MRSPWCFSKEVRFLLSGKDGWEESRPPGLKLAFGPTLTGTAKLCPSESYR